MTATEYPTYEAYCADRAKHGLQVISRSFWNSLKEGLPMSYTARREEGTHPESKMPFGNHWVVRDRDGSFIDCDQFRNDLKCRYDNLTVIDTKLEGLDGKKVRLVNGQIVTLDHKLGTKTLPERYESRCGSFRFYMDGQSTIRAKYDIQEVVS